MAYTRAGPGQVSWCLSRRACGYAVNDTMIPCNPQLAGSGVTRPWGRLTRVSPYDTRQRARDRVSAPGFNCASSFVSRSSEVKHAVPEARHCSPPNCRDGLFATITITVTFIATVTVAVPVAASIVMKRPVGRAPKGMKWSGTAGWVREEDNTDTDENDLLLLLSRALRY